MISFQNLHEAHQVIAEERSREREHIRLARLVRQANQASAPPKQRDRSRLLMPFAALRRGQAR